jgi:hypothetical protein
MNVAWFSPTPDGKGGFANKVVAPGRYNFLQAAIYRLKLSNIPNRRGLELYPTLEVVPANMRTATFLAHSAVPVTFTDDDFEQVVAGNFLVKVVYLPDPQYQDLATTGPDEVVSSRLEPGVDPIAEARRRGSILLVVRLGNIDLESPNTPAMDAPNPFIRQTMPQAPPGNGLMAPGLPHAVPMIPSGQPHGLQPIPQDGGANMSGPEGSPYQQVQPAPQPSGAPMPGPTSGDARSIGDRHFWSDVKADNKQP